MKILSLLVLCLLSVQSFAITTKTAKVQYEFDVEYQKIKNLEVICVNSYDAREDGDGDQIAFNEIWYSGNSYLKVKNLLEKGFQPKLNAEAGEQCESQYGSTPTIHVYTYAYLSKALVNAEMARSNKSFVKRDVLFVKTKFDRETLLERVSTEKDDILSDAWAE
ncbi:MAG: hypothetical protein ACPGJV_02205 [Bacteriovoracaceae bacterium]